MDPAKPVRVPFDRFAATRAARLRENRIEVFDGVYNTLRQAADNRLPASTAPPADRLRRFWEVPGQRAQD